MVVAAPTVTGRLSLQCEAIASDSCTIRSLDWERSRFDIEFGLRNGTTYNSFLVRGERTALIDTSHAKFRDTWIPLLQEQIDPQTIDLLIVSHTEPDHSGLIGDLLDLNPEIEIVGSKVAIQFLENQVHRPFKSRAVKSGDELDLGTNRDSGVSHRFEFLSAPNLHWPDTIFSFDHGTGVLYTCDAFGLHYCSDDVFDCDPGAIAPDFRFYYDCLMGPNARSVLQALKRMDALPEINTIAVGHGPLLREHLQHWIDDYRTWSGQRSKGESYAAVCYLSQYGFSDRISQAIAHGIGKAEAQVQLVDLRATDPQELTALIGDAKAVVVPTWPAEPDSDLQAAIGTLLAALGPKQTVGVYDAFGGNDEPIDAVASQLRSQGQKEAFAPLRIRQLPSGADYQRCEEAGTDLGQLLTRAKTIAAMKSLDGDLDKALGRLSGGLYVVTASQGEGEAQRRSAMVASWVSQASFAPPGLTVAVAKDRAIETLMQVGDRFVLNVLRNDNHQELMRHFLKRFRPGADRFEGVNVLEGVADGGPVLGDALAYLGCRVEQRMEGPDHWIIYAVVEQGNVADTEAMTAVHHRKVGNHY
ncbi:flavoprotein involved in Mehler reaction [Synechococcus sp. A18-25c]|uniref:diflavin flavoprotein n=1 Tax=unclassified Synechococcus TaxID=2626047 RepID=UPI0016490466|nr:MULTISPECIES: diflavin flavoprotein [unclassified Synechococcus]MEC7248835.1 diflavin flavoprotein [Cyanobacteriota bacterium]MEC7896051.1 diflavin flavoprotein [Cyanobacteriota bacterium]QNI49533.1 flavoprotein involved in Mehler reaction [Synechococcus sp. A15-60]QNJ21147.1 flavoprotein involved in Mehler reaction [Synechococcus sp. A18-25c]|tara:strand:+ start:1629 stop:3383 length:1755 start_codon:yes stop_codon:yes gene_type:complete